MAVVLTISGSVSAALVNDPALSVQLVASGLASPTGIAFIGDDDILVLQELDGTVRRIVGGVLLPSPVLDLPVDNMLLDRGLLGIALDPDFVNHRYAYLFYVEADVDGGTTVGIRITRFRWDGAALVEPRIVLTPPIRPNVFRVGGKLVFGADDMLYTVVGDQQFGAKLQNIPAGANPNDTSVIFRTFSDGATPADNPFAGSTGPLQPMNRYYAYGIRNSFGLAVDPVSGALWDTENGQNAYDEINRVERGMNSGWLKLQGPDARDPDGVADLWTAPGAVYSDPEFSWATPVAPTSISFIQNPKLGCDRLHDALVAGTNCGLLYHFPVDAQRAGFALSSAELTDLVADNNTSDPCVQEQAEISFGSGFGIITDAVTGPDGLVYVVSLDQGSVYRIVPNRTAASDADADGVEDVCDCNPASAGAFAPPAELRRIRLSGAAPTKLGWDDQRATIGSSATYGVVSGALSDLRATGSFSAACALGGSLTTQAVTDSRPAPAAGDGYYYLVRASNSCGVGTYGRPALDSASPSVCP